LPVYADTLFFKGAEYLMVLKKYIIGSGKLLPNTALSKEKSYLVTAEESNYVLKPTGQYLQDVIVRHDLTYQNVLTGSSRVEFYSLNCESTDYLGVHCKAVDKLDQQSLNNVEPEIYIEGRYVNLVGLASVEDVQTFGEYGKIIARQILYPSPKVFLKILKEHNLSPGERLKSHLKEQHEILKNVGYRKNARGNKPKRRK
jgi:hypothetical protein